MSYFRGVGEDYWSGTDETRPPDVKSMTTAEVVKALEEMPGVPKPPPRPRPFPWVPAVIGVAAALLLFGRKRR